MILIALCCACAAAVSIDCFSSRRWIYGTIFGMFALAFFLVLLGFLITGKTP